MQYILASTSPRRKELLSLLVLDFTVLDTQMQEKPYKNLQAKQKALQLSRDKCFAAQTACSDNKDKVIISGDTIVECEGRIFEKPKDMQDAYRMIKSLSGKTHRVYTGVSICFKGFVYSFVETTFVYIDYIDENTIQKYIKTNEPYDKAGGYAIQGFMAKYIKKISGDYNNVVGLPIARLYKLLKLIKAI